jgi:hypothetical protein
MAVAISGARAELSVNGKVIGFATGVSVSENIQQVPIEVLGHLDPVEIIPVGRSVSMTADYVRILTDSLVTQGVWPKANEIIGKVGMTAIITDSVANKTVMKLDGVHCQTRSVRVDKGGMMTVNATFIAVSMTDDE